MSKVVIEAGERFGRLTAVAETAKKNGARRMLCKCDCGGEKACIVSRLRSGMNKSCGCLWNGGSARGNLRLTRRTHGERNPNGKRVPEYTAWAQMKGRCGSATNRAFHNYGGRGITVCERWRHDYSAFLADMGRRPSPDHSLDRINVNGNYEPGNCRWATAVQQSQNTRRNRVVSFRGQNMCLTAACVLAGLPESRVRMRLKRGVTLEQALGA